MRGRAVDWKCGYSGEKFILYSSILIQVIANLGRKVVDWKWGALGGKLILYYKLGIKGFRMEIGCTPWKVDPQRINKL